MADITVSREEIRYLLHNIKELAEAISLIVDNLEQVETSSKAIKEVIEKWKTRLLTTGESPST